MAAIRTPAKFYSPLAIGAPEPYARRCRCGSSA